MRPPPTPALPIEEPTRLGRPGQRRGGIAGGQCAPRCRQQQLGPLGRAAVDLVQLGDRGLGLLLRVPEQSCSRQGGTAAHAEIGLGDPETLEAVRRLVKAVQRFGQIAESEGDRAPVHGDLR